MKKKDKKRRNNKDEKGNTRMFLKIGLKLLLSDDLKLMRMWSRMFRILG